MYILDNFIIQSINYRNTHQAAPTTIKEPTDPPTAKRVPPPQETLTGMKKYEKMTYHKFPIFHRIFVFWIKRFIYSTPTAHITSGDFFTNNVCHCPLPLPRSSMSINKLFYRTRMCLCATRKMPIHSFIPSLPPIWISLFPPCWIFLVYVDETNWYKNHKNPWKAHTDSVNIHFSRTTKYLYGDHENHFTQSFSPQILIFGWRMEWANGSRISDWKRMSWVLLESPHVCWGLKTQDSTMTMPCHAMSSYYALVEGFDMTWWVDLIWLALPM